MFRERLDDCTTQLPCHAGGPVSISSTHAVDETDRRPPCRQAYALAVRRNVAGTFPMQTRPRGCFASIPISGAKKGKAELSENCLRDHSFVSTRRENMAFSRNGQVRFFSVENAENALSQGPRAPCRDPSATRWPSRSRWFHRQLSTRVTAFSRLHHARPWIYVRPLRCCRSESASLAAC